MAFDGELKDYQSYNESRGGKHGCLHQMSWQPTVTHFMQKAQSLYLFCEGGNKLVLDICICIVCQWAFADADMHETQICVRVCVSECVQSTDVKAGIRLAYIAQSSAFAIQ